MLQPFTIDRDLEERDDERTVIENYGIAILVIKVIGKHLHGRQKGFAAVNRTYDACRINLLPARRTRRLRCDDIHGSRESSIRPVNGNRGVIESATAAPGNCNSR